MKSCIPTSALLAALLASSALAHDVHDNAHKTRHAAAAFDAAKAVQTPFGIAGDPGRVNRVIKLAMSDTMRFTPDRLAIRLGDTVKLSVSNNGKALHEIVLGTREDLAQHAKMMKMHPDMAHSAPQMLHVTAGKTGEIVWRFNQAGQFDFACLIPGHFEAGMRGTITVAPAPAKGMKQ